MSEPMNPKPLSSFSKDDPQRGSAIHDVWERAIRGRPLAALSTAELMIPLSEEFASITNSSTKTKLLFDELARRESRESSDTAVSAAKSAARAA
jgi:hypothetical protein